MSLTQESKIPDFIFYIFNIVFLYFQPTYKQLLFLLIFVLIDTISGIMLSLHNGEKFRIKKLWITVRKLFSFSLITMVGYILDEAFIAPVFGGRYMFVIFMMFLALSEFKSIIDNFGKILKIDIWNIVVKAFKKDKTL